MKIERATAVACLILGSLALSARPADAQIAKIVDNSGRSFFVNSNTASVKLAPASKAHTNIYLPGEISFTGLAHPAVDMDRDGVEKLVREAAGQLLDAIPVHIHSRVRESCKRNLSRQINVGVRFRRGGELDRSRVRVDKKATAAIVHDLSDLSVGRPSRQRQRT